MTRTLAESELPAELSPFAAVDAAYPAELTRAYEALRRRLPVLIECEKELSPFLYRSIRDRLKADGARCLYLDGRAAADLPPPPQGVGLVGAMIHQIREVVRGAVGERIVVLPHLDILTASGGAGGLGAEAREVIPLLYENPEVLWLGFKDPAFPLPQPIMNLFPHKEAIIGTPRDRLRFLITQREARKLGRHFDPYALYKHISGVNAVRLRRLLASLQGEDYPTDPAPAFAQLRTATLSGDVELPNVDLEKDIGGYKEVKDRLGAEILAILSAKDKLSDPAQIAKLESLIPRGMIFWGPPGTGKTLFAKAMATALGAAVTVVSGPELKSKWVGESLPWEEEVFVIVNGRPRRMPIGELVDNHKHGDDVRTWTVRDDGSALLARVSAFFRHRGPDYIDVLVTETGREVRVTGGHSLFVRDGDQLAEVFAEQVVPGETRIAVPLRLEAPQSLHELNLLELLAGREDVQVEGYEVVAMAAIERVGMAQVAAAGGAAITQLAAPRRPPLTLGAFQTLARDGGVPVDPSSLVVRCGNRTHALPALLPLTPDLGEFLGRWVADGCYANTGVRIACHADEVDQVAALCERLFGHVTRYVKSPRAVDLVINHTLLRRLMLEGLGMQDGSARKRVPAEIFLAPKPTVAAFLRGYFSGDGTFNGKYIEATTISRDLANDIATLLQYFGIAARLRTKRERTGSTSHRVRFLWTEFLRRFANEIGFADERRNRRLRAYLDGIKLKRDVQTPAAHITKDVLWDRIVAKRREPYAREHVYDLSVPRTERFIAGFGNVLVHNSEENLRAVFMKARQCAPSVIVFDELDSFASARGTYTGSGVEHSMVNQLLTEMDGFRKEELVFVVGTTNFVESLDAALMRPGRFEFALHIPYPNREDRRAILKVHDKKLGLEMTDAAFDHACKRTGEPVPGPSGGTNYSGDHLQALCRQIARTRLREGIEGPTEPQHVDRAIEQYLDLPKLLAAEELVVATHEAGHAVVSLMCTHSTPIDRISIRGDIGGALGYVKHADPAHRYVVTYNQLRDSMCTLFGGREAEALLLDDISIGSASDLDYATQIARSMVEQYGDGGDDIGVGRWAHHKDQPTSEHARARIDQAIQKILERERNRARTLLGENKGLLIALRDLLLEKKVLDRTSFSHLFPTKDIKTEESRG